MGRRDARDRRRRRRFGRPAGTLHRFDAGSAPLPAHTLRSSTHAFGVPDAIELARALGTLPPRLEVYAVEGEDFSTGRHLSPAVEKAVETLARSLSAGGRAGRSRA